MVQEKIVYNNNGFQIIECPRLKEYSDSVLNDNDRVYRIRIIGMNQPTFDDICETLFYLLKNKVYDHAFEFYKQKVVDTLGRAADDRKSNGVNLYDFM